MKFVPRSEKTRQAIIEATAVIFNEKGYVGTSITDLTKATRLTSGSIYGNFENKEEVAYAAFDHNLDRVRRRIRVKVEEGVTFRDKVLAHAAVYYRKEDSAPMKGGCPLMNTVVDADDTHEGLRKRAADGLMHWKESLAILVNAGMQAGEFKPGTDAEKTALHIISLIEGSILLGNATRNFSMSNAMLDIVKDVVADISVNT